jgi:hypothetical protein
MTMDQAGVRRLQEDAAQTGPFDDALVTTPF